ncbi:MAG: ADP-ribosylglycohydrolase family protein [Bacteroidaceae bacterium]|nr:ADP-ribosylglycohydrolase family protein [Bacteroidaceae bacterium]
MTKDSKTRIIGAIIGDVVGSTFEFVNKIPAKFKLFRNACSFTDDTVLTVAIADALLHNRTFADAICDWGERYTYAGFGGSFREWKKRRKKDPNATNNSKGNGCGMRVSPVGFWAKSIDEAMSLAKESAIITHNSPEGIAGAQAIATAVFMAKEQRGKEEIKQFVEKTFGYDLDLSYEEIWSKVNEYDNVNKLRREREWAENTCPVAIIAFLNSNSYEETIRTAISYGGDVDTIACMAGGIAAAYYGVPQDIIDGVAPYLPQDIIDVVNEFDGLTLVNRNTPSQIDRWVKKGHVLVYGSGKDFAGKTKSGSLLRNNEPVGYIANRRFGSKHQLEGLAGNSYAIPTVGVTLEEIGKGVERFTAFVNEHPDLVFLVTNIGCSPKAGFTPAEIAPLFSCIADNANVMLPKEFRDMIEKC